MPEWKYTSKNVTKEEAQKSLAAIKSACFHCGAQSNDCPISKTTDEIETTAGETGKLLKASDFPFMNAEQAADVIVQRAGL